MNNNCLTDCYFVFKRFRVSEKMEWFYSLWEVKNTSVRWENEWRRYLIQSSLKSTLHQN